MSLLGRLFLLFVGVPLLELFILVQVGQLVGVWPTIGLVVLTGVTGAALARLEGLRTVWKVRGELARGRLPGGALLDGLAILLGGALLLTPGILTDVVGFSFLLPPTRKVLLKRVRKGLETRLKSGAIRITQVGWGGGPSGEGANESHPWRGQGPWGREGGFGNRGPWADAGSQDGERQDSSGEIVIESDESPDG